MDVKEVTISGEIGFIEANHAIILLKLWFRIHTVFRGRIPSLHILFSHELTLRMTEELREESVEWIKK